MRSCGVFLTVLLAMPALAAQAEDRPPNIVVIVADDLGFSDLGCYGSEIRTPHLDQLANQGVRFTQFYNTARCWPSRSALLSGYYPQQIHRDELPGLGGGGRGRRQTWAHLLPERLKSQGYHSYHSGKWHVDGPVLAGGFEHSYQCEGGRFFNPRNHFEDDVRLPAVEPDSGYYTTTAVVDYALKYLHGHQAEHGQEPFFLYLAFIAPHFPLQAPQADIQKYAGHYAAGWDELRQARFDRQQKMHLLQTSLSRIEPDVGPPYDFPQAIAQLGPGEINRPLPWNQLTPEQQKFQATKMEIHAAMVDRMDQEIGRVLEQLRQMNAWDNTLILFLSDNGASAEIMVRDDGHDPSAPPGSHASYLCLGPGFSSLANTPFRRHKTWVHEGGISTPLIAHWPQRIRTPGALRHSPGHVIDLVPTLLEIAGISPQTQTDSAAPQLPGKSLVNALADDVIVPREFLWWLHEGNRAIRQGNWKLVAARDDPWELYDLTTDRAESQDLASQHPEQVKSLAELWQRQFDETLALAKQTRELGFPPAAKGKKPAAAKSGK